MCLVEAVEVRRVRSEEWEALRDVRVRALADAPDAFGTTHAEALARPDAWWIEWARRSAESDEQAMALAQNVPERDLLARKRQALTGAR